MDWSLSHAARSADFNVYWGAGGLVDSVIDISNNVVVPFFPPRPEERWEILDLHLPANHTVDPAFLTRVAQICQLTGGQLRNAALHASLLALDDKGVPVTTAHLEEAIRSEYRKAGAAYPLAREGFGNGSESVGAFIAAFGSRP